MTLTDILQAVFLGVLEGATEFIPVSSTGHLLLLQAVFGLDSEADKTFAILIQFGAILALLSVYFARILDITLSLPHDPAARRFVIGLVIAFLPAAFLGVLLRDFIVGVLFDPHVVCTTLILGGIVLLIVDRANLPQEQTDATRFPLPMYLKIGVFQCLAMIPGVSRSGATIVGAMLMGADRRAAAEFSFFLAMPTMAGAFVWELGQSYGQLATDDVTLIVIGFISAFVAGVFVVRSLLSFVARRGFAFFGWWRIMVGTLGFIGLFTFA
ncbi:MAG: undecaprenyl-diphosphate phosphatase [Salinarimonadaceae bacterium]|nr:MAG: undecaprenyl-diphosphate phosphatase [Salinarimonadaceae bacterium]